MSTTTPDAIYRGILSRLQTQLSSSLASAYIYMAAKPVFDERQNQIVQLITGIEGAINFNTGDGLVREDFQIAHFRRLSLDHGAQNTQLMTNDTLGLYKLVSTVRSAINQHQLSASVSGAVEPIRLIRASTVRVDPESESWAMLLDTYRIGYQIDWTVS